MRTPSLPSRGRKRAVQVAGRAHLAVIVTKAHPATIAAMATTIWMMLCLAKTLTRSLRSPALRPGAGPGSVPRAHRGTPLRRAGEVRMEKTTWTILSLARMRIPSSPGPVSRLGALTKGIPVQMRQPPQMRRRIWSMSRLGAWTTWPCLASSHVTLPEQTQRYAASHRASALEASLIPSSGHDGETSTR